MKLLKVSMIIAVSASLYGCAMQNSPQARWYKQGSTPDEVKARYAKCIYDVGMNKVDPVREQTLIESCMYADGYKWGVPDK